MKKSTGLSTKLMAHSSRITTTILFVAIAFTLCAQNGLSGTWRSESMEQGSEKMTMEYIFKNSTQLEMAFLVENTIPQVGRCLARVSVQGTYSTSGPIFNLDVDKNTLAVVIQEFELASEMAEGVPQSMLPLFKEELQKQLETSAASIFEPFDGSSMIYGRNEELGLLSFIIGDENESMEIVFTRQ